MNFFLHHYLIWDVRLEEPNELVVDDHIRMELALTGLIQQVPTDFFFLHGQRGEGLGSQFQLSSIGLGCRRPDLDSGN